MTDKELAEMTSAYEQMRRERESRLKLSDFLRVLPSVLFIIVILSIML